MILKLQKILDGDLKIKCYEKNKNSSVFPIDGYIKFFNLRINHRTKYRKVIII